MKGIRAINLKLGTDTHLAWDKILMLLANPLQAFQSGLSLQTGFTAPQKYEFNIFILLCHYFKRINCWTEDTYSAAEAVSHGSSQCMSTCVGAGLHAVDIRNHFVQAQTGGSAWWGYDDGG